MSPSEASSSRLATEISLLTAIYPDQTTYSPQSQELKFTQDNATLHLRIPDTYPESGLPDILSATDPSKNDIRTQTRSAVTALSLPAGEEVLDALIAAFQAVLSDRMETASAASVTESNVDSTHVDPNAKKTVIIWLHHLLNTNKRKLCLSPPLNGVTKPGYPGVLVYSGPAAAVDAHVGELKKQNWAAFQVRFEEEVEWRFGGEGVREVESMGEVVKLLGDVEKSAAEGGSKGAKGEKDGGIGREVGRGQRQKEEFLRAVGIK